MVMYSFVPTCDLGLQFVQDLDTVGSARHLAWNSGRYASGACQGTTTMFHLTRDDIPFHYQLADAFTIATPIMLSMTPTDPNGYTCGPAGGQRRQRGGPVIDNAELLF